MSDFSRPLADRIRPASLGDVVGQSHLVGKNGILRRVVESGEVPNMIFYGPSGVGKTTVANIIAARAERPLYRLNATTASIADIKEVTSASGGILGSRGGVLLYLDEIQYFNKRQQQSLLEFIENGSVTLIASTTENPYFYVYNAILSRSTVFEFKPVAPAELRPAILRAISLAGADYGAELIPEDGVVDFVANNCGGDVRKAVNAVELMARAASQGVAAAPMGEAESGKSPESGGKTVALTLDDARAVAQRSSNRYDRDGDEHYDLLSALQKSIRGSDPDAAVYYLGRLLSAGDIISPCRRLLVMASEDVGLAHPQAVAVVKACCDAARELGLPEAALPLGEAAVFLATCPKSNSSANAIWSAMAEQSYQPPEHLKDSHYPGAEKLGHGGGYKYPHDFPNHWTRQQYLPDALAGKKFYEFGENKTESAAKAYWDRIKENDNG